MKIRFTLVGICALLILAVTYTSFAQGKKKDNGKNEQQHKNDKEDNKRDKKEDNKRDKEDKGNRNHDKEGKENGNKAHDTNHDKADHTNNSNKHIPDAGATYHWNHENFKERKKLKQQEKVTICHKTGNNEPGVALNVSRNALQAHINHGDAMGECPKITNTHFSNTFLNRRNEYYNTLQNTQEQVMYSRSMYEYAVERLTNSRTQLVLMQKNNVPVAEIQTKQAVVTELEQNVSLLQTLIGVAVNLLVNKLQ
jgi:hypothetical protein